MYALILAGGRGERLRPLTDTVPKVMVPVLGKPVIWYQLHWLRFYGVTDVVVLGGYFWQTIRDFLGDGKKLGVKVEYSIEAEPLGRGGAFKKGLSLLDRNAGLFIGLNGDLITAVNLADVIQTHRKGGYQATLVLVPLRSPYGVVEVDSMGRVAAFREKRELPHWMNAGIYVMERSIEETLPDKGDHEDSTFPNLAREGKLGGYTTRLFWKTLDNFKDLREMEEELQRRRPELPWLPRK